MISIFALWLSLCVVATTRASVEVGSPMYGKGVNGGVNCGHLSVANKDWTFGKNRGSCTRMILCESAGPCTDAGIDSVQTCAEAAAANDQCPESGTIEARQYQRGVISHCFCVPNKSRWVPDAGHAFSTAYEYKTITTTVTTTTATTATTTTTTTATSTTNTIIQNLQSQLSGVNKLIEEQVVKNEVHVTRLEGKVSTQQEQMAAQAAEIAAQRSQIAEQGKQMQTLAQTVSTIKEALRTLAKPADVAPTTGNSRNDGPCGGEVSDDIVGGGGSGVAPSIETSEDGQSLDIAACSGDMVLHTKECSIKPCLLQQQIIILQNKLGAIELD